jgi:hypothetical protein
VAVAVAQAETQVVELVAVELVDFFNSLHKVFQSIAIQSPLVLAELVETLLLGIVEIRESDHNSDHLQPQLVAVMERLKLVAHGLAVTLELVVLAVVLVTLQVETAAAVHQDRDMLAEIKATIQAVAVAELQVLDKMHRQRKLVETAELDQQYLDRHMLLAVKAETQTETPQELMVRITQETVAVELLDHLIPQAIDNQVETAAAVSS